MDLVIRLLEKHLERWLFKGKAIIITGARQVGKTTMLQNMFPESEEVLWLNADEISVRERLQDQNIQSLKSLVGEKKVVVIDEVQRVQNSGLLLKLLVDNFKKVQVVATGSSALDISDNIFEPLTGRQLRFHLSPFALAELYPRKTEFEIEQQLPFHLVYGSYPDICNYRPEAEVYLKNLSNQYLYKDILSWKDIRKPELLDKLLKLLSYQVGSEVSINEIATQLRVKSETIDSYIDLLEKTFVIFRLNAYSTNERKEVTKMSKIYFWDNGVRNAVIDNFDELSLRNDSGLLWENFVISERLKVNRIFAPDVRSFFWRNYNQSEVDYVELHKKHLFAFEMKWNHGKKHSVSRAFTNAYPHAETQIITPRYFAEFCRVL